MTSKIILTHSCLFWKIFGDAFQNQTYLSKNILQGCAGILNCFLTCNRSVRHVARDYQSVNWFRMRRQI